MKIVVKMGASEDNASHSFQLSDLGFTESEWKKLSESEKNGIIDEAVSDLPCQPCWVVESFKEKT